MKRQFVRLLRRWRNAWKNSDKNNRVGNCNLTIEPLEPRELLANDFLLTWAAGLIVGDFGGSRGGIFVSRPNGADMKQITVTQTNNFQFSGDGLNLPDDHPSFSPDGRQIVFTTSRYQSPGENNNFEIALMNVDGSNVRRLTISPGIDTEPVFSPDGKKIAFASDRIGGGNLDIWVMNADGTGLQRLTTSTDNENEPAWSHAGDRISYTRILFGGVFGVFHGKKDVYIMNANGTNHQLIAGLEAEEHDAVWSLNDQQLILSSEKDGTLPFGNTHVIDIATKQYVSNLTIDDSFLGIGGGGDPTLSPDGTKIAYFKATGGPLLLAGPQKVHVMNANGSGKIKIDAPGIINVHPHFGKLADSDGDGKPDYIDIDSPADLDQALIQDEARVLAFLGNRVILDNIAELALMAAMGYFPVHGFDSFQGMGVVFARDLNGSDPPALGKPDVLMYQPDLTGLFGARNPTDLDGDFNYTLIGWGYGSKYDPKNVPLFAGFPEDLWLVHEAGFHFADGTFGVTTPSGDSPKGSQPGDVRPSTNLLTPWHERLWDIHFFRRPNGGVPVTAIHDPFGRNLPGNPTGSNAFFFPNIPYQGRVHSGERIEAEDFDMGKGFGWQDSTPGNSGNTYRITDVDLAPSLAPAIGLDVVNIRTDDFLQYTVDIPQSANHDFTFHISNTVQGAFFHIEIDGQNVSGARAIPVSSDIKSNVYISTTLFSTFLTAGRHRIRLVFGSLSTSGSTPRIDFFTVTPKTVPSAKLTSIQKIVSPEDFTDFHVTYSDNAAIQASSIDSTDVLVTGPNGYAQIATLVSKSSQTTTQSITATYRITGAGTGWDAADSGTYMITMRSFQVIDSTAVFVPSSTLGSFVVDIVPFRVLENPVTRGFTLYISGTEVSETIAISRTSTTVSATRNGVSVGTAATDNLKSIVVGTVGGNDIVQSTGINLPMRIQGGDGNDQLTGGSLADEIFGNAGDDSLFGLAGNDVLRGGDGNDQIFGDAGNDLLFGDAGNDNLQGDDGSDTLDGGLGTNTLNEGGGLGGIKLAGTSASDVILVDRRIVGNDVQVWYSLNGNVTRHSYLNGETIIVAGGAGDDIIKLIGTAATSWSADFSGGTGNDFLVGGPNEDKLRGGEGDDTLYGEAGSDWIWGGDGRDKVFGQLGDDQLFGGDHDDLVFAGPGNDGVQGHGGDDRLYGENGNDILTGGAGADWLCGGAGLDLLVGGAGLDNLNGNGGGDVLIGSATIFDDSYDDLRLLLELWMQPISIDQRIAHLTAELGVTEMNVDDTFDAFSGDGGFDWYVDLTDADRRR